MTTPPKTIRIVGWALFVIASIAINYQVKYAMHHQEQGSVQNVGSLKVGQAAPDFTLQDLDGRPTALSSYRGQKVVLMDFWAMWCGPCRMAMPGLQELADKFKDRPLEILSMNQADKPEDVRSFIARKKYTFHVLLDQSQDVGNLYGVQAIPTFVVIDKKGIVQWLSVGYSDNDSSVEALVDKLTKE